ncbi:DUF2793 domain-containing protein [Maritalea sp.]|uniref:DUF2793 domain-containing protein n=1 Tax=Maritalea sp. TaxID=2003361 RepID=UPI003EF10E85
MTNTDRHKLPLIETNQAQKHITHNESIRAIDALLHLAVESVETNDPPASPEPGNSWIIGAMPTGIWSGKERKIATYDVNGWQYHAGVEGTLVWVKPSKELFSFSAGSWQRFDQQPSLLQNAQFVGVGATADATNKLAVKSDNILFSNDETGSGDVRLNINKAGVSNTSSMTFQSNWSGRAEMGIAGDDDFAIKVSHNGSDWTSSLRISSQTGEIELTQGLSPDSKGSTHKINALGDSGRFATEKTRAVSTFNAPTYLQMENGAAISSHAKFNFDSVDYGGVGAANDVIVKQLVDQIREPSAARYFAEFWVAKIVAGAGTQYENTQGGSSKYRLCSYDLIGGARQTLSVYICALSGTVCLSGLNHQLWVNGARIPDFIELNPSDGWQHVNACSDVAPRFASHQISELLPAFASSGTQMLIALPAVIPDRVRVGRDDGIVPAMMMVG